MKTERGARTAKVREIFAKNPDADPKAVAAQVGINVTSVYAARKKARRRPVAKEPVEATAENQEVVELRDQIGRLKAVIALLLR